MTEYTEGICEDGAAILKDGVQMTVSQVLAELNQAAKVKSALTSLILARTPEAMGAALLKAQIALME